MRYTIAIFILVCLAIVLLGLIAYWLEIDLSWVDIPGTHGA